MKKSFVTPHCHPASFDSGSTIKEMVRREVELGTGTGTCTDHGTMGSCLDYHAECKAQGIKSILGVEIYFRDDNCPILDAAGLVQPLIDKRSQEITKERSTLGYLKYYHLTLHCLNQSAYMALVKVLSRAELHNREHHGSEWKPIFTWADLEELGRYDITVGSGCLIGMVSRHLMANRPDLAEQYYLRLKHIFKPGNFYVEVFPKDCSQNWENSVMITLEDQSVLRLKEDRRIILAGEEIKVKDLLRRKVEPGKLMLDGHMYYSKLNEVNQHILSVELKKGFFKNECSLQVPNGDVQQAANLFVIELARKYGDPVLISDDSHFARPEEKMVQDCRLGNGKDDWKMFGSYHRMDTEEAGRFILSTLPISALTLEEWVNNSYEFASRFKDFDLKFDLQLPTKFYEQFGTPLKYTMDLIRKHGRFDPMNPAMVTRLTTEINMLTKNGTINLLPYFFPLEETVSTYEHNGLLTGPGRGSAAGLLLTYLLGITHVNPLQYDLSMERFITIDRIKAGTLPDIDQDLESRELLVGEDGASGWLYNRFGKEHVAQISTNMNLRLKSSIKDVHRANGTLGPDIERICSRLPTPPQGVNDHDFVFGKTEEDGTVSKEIPGILDHPALKEYMERYPSEWKVVQNMLGIPRNKSKHACAFVISNKPIAEFIPMTIIGGVPCTQYTASAVEKSGGVKIDFLVLNSLKDIRTCLDLIQQRSGQELSNIVPIDGKPVPRVRVLIQNEKQYDIWSLPEDPKVFQQICRGNTETVFQLNTSGASRYLALFRHTDAEGNPADLINSIDDIAIFTSLDRPGPLDYQVDAGKNMLHEYVDRKRGIVSLDSLAYSKYLMKALPETHGVLIFQEQAMRIVQELGGFDPIEANNFRIYVGKKKQAQLMTMKPKFLEGAVPKIGQQESERIWEMLIVFGGYAFNKSHAVSYSVTAYACAYLKHYFPLEWWCSVLQNADKNEIFEKFWRHCRHLVLPPDINLSKKTFVVEGSKIRSPISLMSPVGAVTQEVIASNAPYSSITDFIDRLVRQPARTAVNRRLILRMLVSGVLDSLFPDTTTIEERYDIYMQARKLLLGEKIQPLPPELVNMLPLQRYCVRKSIVPTYLCGQSPGESSFIKSFVKFSCPDAMTANFGLVRTRDRAGNEFMIVEHDRHEYRLSLPETFEEYIVDVSKKCNIAVPVYIVDEERFAWGPNKSREALKLTVDYDGVVTQMVMWPRRHSDVEEIPWDFRKPLKGSVALLCLSRFAEGRDMSIDNIQWICGLPTEEDE